MEGLARAEFELQQGHLSSPVQGVMGFVGLYRWVPASIGLWLEPGHGSRRKDL